MYCVTYTLYETQTDDTRAISNNNSNSSSNRSSNNNSNSNTSNINIAVM